MKIKKKHVQKFLLMIPGMVLISFYQNCSSPNFTAETVNRSSTPGEQDYNTPVPVVLPTPVAVGGMIADLKIENTGSTEQLNVPYTFGQVFALGNLLPNEQLAAKLSDGNLLPLQLDVKAKHADGSVRHAIISGILPKLPIGKPLDLALIKAASTSQGPSSVVPAALLNSGFATKVEINLSGQIYSASADSLLQSGKVNTWLSGPITNEWLVSAPLKTSAGAEHPHLRARFAIRSYAGLPYAKVDVVLENNWAYIPAPQNLTYDVQVSVGGKNVYSKPALKHYTQARWKKSFSWGTAPQIHIRHNSTYLIATRAIPNYDSSLVIPDSVLATMQKEFAGLKVEPMEPGVAEPYMPATGGRPDIGLLPGWAASYLLSMDKRAKDVTLGMGELAGSWSAHYRDEKTDRPVSLLDYPHMTLAGNPGDTYNPKTKLFESFPACGGDCNNPNVVDSAHQPNFAYLPYLVTGDFYFLEELQFYAMMDLFESNPGYRENGKALLKSGQVRSQAWSLRTLAEAAYITPDADPLKSHFQQFLDSNLDWYNTNYPENLSANKLGIIANGYALAYDQGNGLIGVAPWQDDFFTQAVGHVAELGFLKAQKLLVWKTKFPIGRMVDPGYCWIRGATYALTVKDSATSPIYDTLSEAYQKTFPSSFTSLPCAGLEMASNLGLKVGEMAGYSYASAGYPANMQPALAYGVDSGATNGTKAWSVFMGRSVKPDYSESPQFAIVPR